VKAQTERWAEAADDLGRAVALDRIETFEMRYQHTLLLRKKGDMPGYRKAVAFLRERWGDTRDAKIARRLLQASLLEGEKAVDRKSVERLVQVLLSWNRLVLTVPARREAGTYAELRQLLKSVGMKQDNQNLYLTWPYFPLVCERLGDEYGADFWLRQVARQIAEKESL
jgi:hypothetical protein